jgi:hypothetical protein
MTVNAGNRQILLTFGFTAREVDAFDAALAPDGTRQAEVDLSSQVWNDVIMARQELVRQLRDTFEREQGRTLTRQKRDMLLNTFYTGEADPFVWLRKEYKPMPKKDFVSTESIDRARREAQQRIATWKRQIRRTIKK